MNLEGIQTIRIMQTVSGVLSSLRLKNVPNLNTCKNPCRSWDWQTYFNISPVMTLIRTISGNYIFVLRWLRTYGEAWMYVWRKKILDCRINFMLQICKPGKRISTPALRDVSKSKLTVCWLALSPLSPLHSLYSYSEPRTSDGRTEFCLLFTICVSVVQLSSLLFQLFLLFPISPQQALRLSWAPPLKYDSHYSGYNLLAFFNVFMTAALTSSQ